MENKRRDEKYGVPERDAPIDTRELADKVRGISLLCPRYRRLTMMARHLCFVMCHDKQQQIKYISIVVLSVSVIRVRRAKACMMGCVI